MPKKTTKKRIVLWVLLTVFLLLFAVIAIPIATLYLLTQKMYQEAMSGAVKG